MSEPKKLIEVAMPIKEISAESVRDKSLRHGHISTLHLWWARRPLPVCRATIFASIIPDPLDSNCPEIIKEGIELLLGKLTNPGDPYAPYDDIPYTSAVDKMEDNLRNRLMMFIGKFSNKFLENEKKGKLTPAKEILSDFSLIKWESHCNEEVLIKAQKLIYIAHNYNLKNSLLELLTEFDLLQNDIRHTLNLFTNFNLDGDNNDEKFILEKNFQRAIEDFRKKMPNVFDPFTGGGAIPLEASRLGCNSFGNDLNPVAHIIQKATCEYPQKYGKKIVFSEQFYNSFYSNNTALKLNELKYDNKVVINNRLVHDIKYYANILISELENNCEDTLIQKVQNKNVVALLWVKQAICINPTCGIKVPLIKNFNLSNKQSLKPNVSESEISFEIQNTKSENEPWINRGTLKCPLCNSITDSGSVKNYIKNNLDDERLVAVVVEGSGRKEYLDPKSVILNDVDLKGIHLPNETMQRNSAGGDTFSWGINKWHQLFSKRQLYHLSKLVEILNDKLKGVIYANHEPEYAVVLISYLSILIDKGLMYSTRHCRWMSNLEAISNIYARQAIPMMMDFAESNLVGKSTGSLRSQLDWITRFVEEESKSNFYSVCVNAASGNQEQFPRKYLDVVITDPPYFDAIAYADISDFFYVWLKKMLANEYTYNFATPTTPKTDECTALKHHHDNDFEKAKNHFENTLLDIFRVIELQTKDLVTIMYAHQSTEAWSTLCNSILNANLNITSSWAIDTERSNSGMKADKAFLSSSVTVCARPSVREGVAEFVKIKKAIESRVENEVESLYKIGFRGADLLTACFGQAVSEFGKFKSVEKADGSNVSVKELLDVARESAFNFLLKGFSGDDFTKFYIGWLQLNGLVDTDFDDAAKFTKVGLSIDVQDLFKEHILIKNNNQQHLGSLRERLNENSKLGEGKSNFIIDQTHKLMHLYSSPNRNNLLKYIESNSFEAESPVWRVLTSLAELLPKDMEDHKLAVGLLSNKEQLIRESKSSTTPKPEQSQLTFE